MRNAVIVVLLLGMTLAGSRHAVAQAPAPDPATEAARDLFEKGLGLFEQRDYAKAAEAFRTAYEIKPATAFIFNEAVCYERLQDRPKAAALFRRYLDSTPQAREREAVEKRIARLTGSTAEAPADDGQISGVVVIESQPSGATVYLDDKTSPPVGTTPWNGSIVGAHTFILVAQGFREEKKTITVKAGQFTNLYIGLSQAQYLGWLEVRANVAGAEVYLDGEGSGAIGRAPFMGNVTPGKHSIVVTRPGYTVERKDLEVVAGEAYRIEAKLERAEVGFVQVGGADLDGAVVKLDGQRVCERAPCRFQTTSGIHRVSVARSGRKTYTRNIPVGKATQTDLTVRLAPSTSHGDAVVKLVIAAALVGGGAYMTVKANDMQRTLDADPMASDDDKRNQKIVRYGGLGLFAAGGIVGVVGLVSLLSEKGPRSEGTLDSRDLTVSVTPDVGPGYRGLLATLRF